MTFFFIPLVTTTLSGIEPERIPAASGVSNFARILANSFGTSIATGAQSFSIPCAVKFWSSGQGFQAKNIKGTND